MAENVGLEEVRAALERIRPFVHRTPVFSSSSLDSLAGRNLHFKAECLQKTGSFKARGATNAILALMEREEEVRGVVTHSGGNHGQAVAYAAGVVGVPCVVVIPQNCQTTKEDAMREYGAKIVKAEPDPTALSDTCDKIAEEEGYHVIHPFDDYHVIAGQGTVALEFHEKVPQLDAILAPVCGGGLMAGIAVTTKCFRPQCKVFAVEPDGKDFQLSLRARRRLWPNPPRFLQTIADTLRHQQPGHITFPLMFDTVEDEVFTVTDSQISEAMKLAMQRLKLVIEPAAAASVAAVLSDQMKEMDQTLRHVGVILCGGNADLEHLPW